ncbi:MAG: uridine kinase [Oscillospiraceae bacterium]|nr:uridine kinase [Oscillospiraceae bacterium]
MTGIVFELILNLINRDGKPVTVAVDGGCCTGKSSLARSLTERFNGNIFRCDDFYLTKELKTPERLAETGGNMDRERLLREVIIPAAAGETVTYRAYSCETCDFLPSVTISPAGLNIVEGAYSHHPDLAGYYDLRIFMKAPRELRLLRLKQRESEKYDLFVNKWMPAEDAYFSKFRIEENADIVLESEFD